MTEKSARKGPLHHIGMAFSFLLLMAVAFVALAVIVVPIASNSTPYTVLTSSMEPVYPPGTLVVVKPIDADDIRIGDVITYQLASGESAVVTHRVTAVMQTPGEETTFTTKGDNNDLADANPVKPVQVRGAVWYAVPFIGWVNNVINGGARSILVPAVASVLFAYAGYMFTSGLVARSRARRRQAAEDAAASATGSEQAGEQPLEQPLEQITDEQITDESLAEFLAEESDATEKGSGRAWASRT